MMLKSLKRIDPSGRCWTILVLLLCPSFLLLFAGEFPFRAGAQYSDFAISHYPNALYLQRSIIQYGEIPLWSDLILGGYPFFANPLSSLWYPPAWIALVFALPAGINVSIYFHLVLGGLGMYVLLRQEKRSGLAALAGAMLFQLAPKLMAHYAAGHVTLLYAISWTPWLLWAEKRVFAHRHNLLPGIFFALIVLADVRWAALTGFLWAGWVGKKIISDAKNWTRTLVQWGVNVFLAIFLAAPLLLPLIEYTQLSTRASMSLQDNLAYSLPFLSALGLFFPTTQINPEWVMFPGQITLIMLVYFLGRRSFWSDNWFWHILILVSVVVAFGDNLPVGQILFRLPGFNGLRVPARSLFFIYLGFAALLAWSVDALRERFVVLERRGMFCCLVYLLVILIISIFLGIAQGQIPPDQLWAIVGMVFGLILVVFRKVENFKVWAVLLIVGLAGEGLVFAGRILDFRPAGETVMQKELQQLEGEKTVQGLFRIYSPSYSVRQEFAALNELQLADGVDPLQLRNYSEFMQKATGVDSAGYSVTLPAFSSGKPTEDNKGKKMDLALLGLVNVKYIVSAYLIDQDGLELAWHENDVWAYQNTNYLPRAWVELASDGGKSNKNVDSLSWKPNSITVNASGPGRLVVSEVVYPGWNCWVDGKKCEIDIVYGILRSVSLEDGAHKISLEFMPTSMHFGLLLSLLAFIFIVIIWKIK